MSTPTGVLVAGNAMINEMCLLSPHLTVFISRMFIDC